MPPLTETRLREFLAAHTTMTVATIGPDGSPQAAPLFYAELPDLSLVFTSEAKVRHSRNIDRDERVAVTIYADGQAWQTITGLQLEGVCTRLSRRAAGPAYAAYLQKYPFIKTDPRLALLLKISPFYRIVPHWIRLTDNSQGFGHKAEWRAVTR